MWKRAASLLLARRSALAAHRAPAVAGSAAGALRRAPAFFSTLDAGQARTRVEDVMPIATGLEREEIEAELQGKKRFDMDAPVGPFGTKEAPAVIQSYFDKRIVGCPGGEGEDEHDVVWFWLEKGKPNECPVCTQYFQLEVIGNGGNLDAKSCNRAPRHRPPAVSRPRFDRVFSADAGQARTRVEDVMPIATGLEREEIEAELQGKKRFDMDAPVGSFGTKEAPAVIQSYFDKRIVGCPGGEGEDEHDVVWFWLEKGKLHECPVCTQYFQLEVIGNGGNPDGHDDDDDHHHLH